MKIEFLLQKVLLRRSLQFLTILLVALAASACDTSKSPRESRGLPDDVAAREFLSVVNRYRARTIPLHEEALVSSYRRRRECPKLLAPNNERDLQVRIAVAEDSINQLTAKKAVAPEFRKLATNLASIPTDSSVLRAVVKEARNAGDRAAKLEATDLDLCQLLEEWRRTGWSKDFEEKLLDGYALYGVDSRVVREAHKAGSRLLPRLEKLGLTSQQSLAIAAIPGFF